MNYSVTGEELSDEKYKKHLEDVLPTEKDREELKSIFKEDNDWIQFRPFKLKR